MPKNGIFIFSKNPFSKLYFKIQNIDEDEIT